MQSSVLPLAQVRVPLQLHDSTIISASPGFNLQDTRVQSETPSSCSHLQILPQEVERRERSVAAGGAASLQGRKSEAAAAAADKGAKKDKQRSGQRSEYTKSSKVGMSSSPLTPQMNF